MEQDETPADPEPGRILLTLTSPVLSRRSINIPPLPALIWSVAAIVTCAGIALVHFRWVMGHFSTDGYLLDSGWLAYLLESGDPLLENPSAVNDLSFYAHHLSPHLFLFGAPFSRLLNLNGFEILAVHEAVFFGVFAAALMWGSYVDGRARFLVFGFLGALTIGALSNVLLQAAGYPHYEIATLSVTTLALVAWEKRWRRLFLACVIWLPLIREDGGFYAAFAAVASWVIAEQDQRVQHRGLLLAVFVAGIVLSGASMLLKREMFPGFDAFQSNFSGQSWSHLSWPFIVDRARAAVTNPNIVPVLLGCGVLATRDLRYAAGLALLLPLFLLHLASVRDEHGQFTLYFALPWLLPAVVWLLLLARRHRLGHATMAEALVVVVLGIAMTAPAQAAAGIRTNFWYVIPWSLERPIFNLESMRRFARNAHRTFDADGAPEGRACASVGVAALIPNDLRPKDVVALDVGLSECRTVLLMAGDIQSTAIGVELEARRFQKVGEFEAVQLWIQPEPAEQVPAGNLSPGRDASVPVR